MFLSIPSIVHANLFFVHDNSEVMTIPILLIVSFVFVVCVRFAILLRASLRRLVLHVVCVS